MRVVNRHAPFLDETALYVYVDNIVCHVYIMVASSD